MPRNIRPAWGAVKVDGIPKHATGPNGRDGEYLFALSVREKGSVVTDAVEVEAIGAKDRATTLLRVTVRGKVVHEERIEQ